jgi:hypothetical protein
MSTWIISDAATDRELGTIQNKFQFFGSKIIAEGEFGHYTIEGNFGNHAFTISKDGQKVSLIFLLIIITYIKKIFI